MIAAADLQEGMTVCVAQVSCLRKTFNSQRLKVIRRGRTKSPRIWVLEDENGYRQAVWIGDDDLELVLVPQNPSDRLSP